MTSPSPSSLYGLPRPNSKPKSSTTTTTNPTHSAFTSTLSSLLAITTSSRPRPSSLSTHNRKPPKDSIFTTHNRGTKKRAHADISTSSTSSLSCPQSHAPTSETVDSATLHRSKRKMEEKARLYASMKRGDYVPPRDGGVNKEDGALVDFDRKWAEGQDGGRGDDTSSGDDDDDDEEGGDSEEMVEYEDEFGRQRRGTRVEVAREMRRRNAQAYATEELAGFSARPARPANLIHGDTIQAAAFNPDELRAEQMERLAGKRDRSMTPPEEVHYDASKEVRSKGVGFYNFSKDGEGRKREMEALERERAETEKGRREREERKEERRKKVDERRKMVAEKRGERLADRFLDSL